MSDPDIAPVIKCFETPEACDVDIRRWSDIL